MRIVDTPYYCRDIQEVTVQDDQGVSVRHTVVVTLEDDLVDTVRVGDKVRVIGTVRRRWGQLGKGPGQTTDIQLTVQVVQLYEHFCYAPPQAAGFCVTDPRVVDPLQALEMAEEFNRSARID